MPVKSRSQSMSCLVIAIVKLRSTCPLHPLNRMFHPLQRKQDREVGVANKLSTHLRYSKDHINP